MRSAGYLLNTREGLTGERGIFYDYILAGNGLFVRAQNRHLRATINIAPAEVRGLLPLEKSLELPGGRIPRGLYDLALSVMAADPWRERYLAITWDGSYRLRMPVQEMEGGGVSYERLPDTLVDIHSHASMGAFFSQTDNEDEQGFGLYMVIGKVDTTSPEVKLRLGVYGYFAPITLPEVFDV
jgi:PRTRC genetic system protein A